MTPLQLNLELDNVLLLHVSTVNCTLLPVDMRASRRKVLQQQLVNIIMRVLCKHQDLHYYQVGSMIPCDLKKIRCIQRETKNTKWWPIFINTSQEQNAMSEIAQQCIFLQAS